MEDDLNTPMALATIFDQIRETNKYIDNNGKSLGVKTSYIPKEKVNRCDWNRDRIWK